MRIHAQSAHTVQKPSRWSTRRRSRLAHMKAAAYLQRQGFEPPAWASELSLVPDAKISMAMLPTPIHDWRVPGVPDGVQLFIKRDDLTGMQLSGNKVRKLEFLMAETLAGGHDTVVTIGGIQSNHCRATSTAATYLGMEPHLILRNTERGASQDPGLVGNLLVERMQGAHIHQVSKAEYVEHGSEALTAKLARDLEAQGRKPYIVPVGGSNSLGCWGYMMAMQEIMEQTKEQKDKFTHIVMACGSGATTAGIALANHLSGYGAKVIGYGVCDDETYFYNFLDGLLSGLGATQKARDIVHMRQSKGAGYAISREEELQTALSVATTGILVDPVYSGKAVHGLLHDMKAQPEVWQDAKVLFIHTGGLLGMYEKTSQLQPLVEQLGRSHRLQV